MDIDRYIRLVSSKLKEIFGPSYPDKEKIECVPVDIFAAEEEIVEWNIRETPIISIIKESLSEEKLKEWSESLRLGVRTIFAHENVYDIEQRSCEELWKFVLDLRKNLGGDRRFKRAKGHGSYDPILTAIISGIKSWQNELDLPGSISFLKFRLLERYLDQDDSFLESP